ncbi:MAG TPA: glucoamylase family protein, partial [Micromonosporaceae bacterium]|nr:glucoamylase family protein [Micromonosporaceae bacterium]
SADEAVLTEYARDTWASFVAMVDPNTGLVSDNIDGDLDPASRSAYTSPTNVAMYFWAVITARHMGLISRPEARERVAQTLGTLARLDYHEQSGMFYNWYDPATGDVLRIWPENGNTVYPFLSSVDNGWLGAGLLMVANDMPELKKPAHAVLDRMDFGFYYDPAARGPDVPAGLIRGGFWDEPLPAGQCTVAANYRGGPNVYYTCHHYGAFNTEPRIASYLGIAFGQIPEAHYFAGWRTFPDTCDWSWQEQKPIGEWVTYMGVPVFEGTYAYRDMHLVPTWGGSMFEALMVPLVVPEETWGPESWGRNHPLTVQAHIEHGLREAGYGYCGFSPSSNPAGGYREYGVDPIGLEPNGYASDQERTLVDYGFPGCRAGAPLPTSYGDGVVTPHASFLALRYAPEASLANLAALRDNFDAYGPGGFYDAVAVRSGTVAKRYLALDQGMIMAAIGNALEKDALRTAFTKGPISDLRDLMAMEEWPGVRRD